VDPIGYAIGGAGLVLAVALYLLGRRPSKTERARRASERLANARRLELSYPPVPQGGRNSPGFHDAVMLRLQNSTMAEINHIVVHSERGSGSTAWWQRADPLKPGETCDLRLPEEWPCPLSVYFRDELDEFWLIELGDGASGDVRPIRRDDLPSL